MLKLFYKVSVYRNRLPRGFKLSSVHMLCLPERWRMEKSGTELVDSLDVGYRQDVSDSLIKEDGGCQITGGH